MIKTLNTLNTVIYNNGTSSFFATNNSSLVCQNNETAAMLVSQTNPVVVELLSYFLLFQYICMAAGHVMHTLYRKFFRVTSVEHLFVVILRRK